MLAGLATKARMCDTNPKQTVDLILEGDRGLITPGLRLPSCIKFGNGSGVYCTPTGYSATAKRRWAFTYLHSSPNT